MAKTHYGVTTCAAVIPQTGLSKDLFLIALPSDDLRIAAAEMMEKGLLQEKEGRIHLEETFAQSIDIKKDGDAETCMAFLQKLLEEMEASPCVEEERDYLSVFQTFHRTSQLLAGVSSASDIKLAELSAALVNLLKDPCISFINKTDLDSLAWLKVKCDMEFSLTLKIMQRIKDEKDHGKITAMLTFAESSMKKLDEAGKYGLLEPAFADEIKKMSPHIAALLKLHKAVALMSDTLDSFDILEKNA